MLLSVLKHSPEQGGELLFELALPFYDEETPGAVSKCDPAGRPWAVRRGGEAPPCHHDLLVKNIDLIEQPESRSSINTSSRPPCFASKSRLLYSSCFANSLRSHSLMCRSNETNFDLLPWLPFVDELRTHAPPPSTNQLKTRG